MILYLKLQSGRVYSGGGEMKANVNRKGEGTFVVMAHGVAVNNF